MGRLAPGDGRMTRDPFPVFVSIILAGLGFVLWLRWAVRREIRRRKARRQ